jgi:hypothetical protein
MATPSILVNVTHEIRIGRILMNIARHRQKIFLHIYHDRFITSPKQRAIPAVGPIKPLGVDPVQMTHGSAQSCSRCLQEQMIVGIHQTVRIDLDAPQLVEFPD